MSEKPLIMESPKNSISEGVSGIKQNGVVSLHLRPDQTVNYVETNCQNPDSGRQETFTLRLSDELISFGDLILPTKISAFWNNQSYFEIEPMDAAANPTITDDVFELVGE